MERKKSNEKIILYVLFALAVAILLWIGYNLYETMFFGENYQKALQSQDALDKCKTPSGYTDESWRQHMSHHPDMYKECLT